MSKNSVLKSYSGSFYYITRDAKLGIYPTPATGKELKVYYTPTPLEMTQDTTMHGCIQHKFFIISGKTPGKSNHLLTVG